MSYQEMRKEELDKALAKLYENYEKLLEAIQFDGFECVCGRISNQIAKFFNEMGIKADYITGTYKGRGTEFSGGESGTGHCWVELCLRLLDCYESKKVKIIIDGAYAQFFPTDLTPRITRDKQRLMIFIDDKTAEEWYKGNKGSTW